VSVNEDLDLIEKTLRQLQTEWDKFFSGIEKKPPVDLRTRLETLLRKWAGQEMTNSTERFRLQTLTARYNTFNELWNKRLRALEEGRTPGLHLTHTLLVHAHKVAPMEPVLVVPPPAAEPRAAHAPAAGARPAPTATAATASGVRGGDARPHTGAVKRHNDQFVAARRAAGEAGGVKIETFQNLIAQQSTRIRADKGASAVEFRIETKDGKVSLKAKPIL
jgi:hypothetical protein